MMIGTRGGKELRRGLKRIEAGFDDKDKHHAPSNFPCCRCIGRFWHYTHLNISLDGDLKVRYTRYKIPFWLDSLLRLVDRYCLPSLIPLLKHIHLSTYPSQHSFTKERKGERIEVSLSGLQARFELLIPHVAHRLMYFLFSDGGSAQKERRKEKGWQEGQRWSQ